MDKRTVGIIAAIAAVIFTAATIVEMFVALWWNFISISIAMPMLIISSSLLGLVSMFIAIAMFLSLSGEKEYAFTGVEKRASERVADLEELLK